MSPLQIRPYQESDDRAVIELWNESSPAHAPHNDPATAIRKKLQVQRELFFVADVDGTVVGTAMGGYDGHRGWIYAVAVKPQFRRRGIGSALLRRAEAALSDLGCLKVNLQVFSTNAEVVAFYEQLGYSVEERISMGKRLYEEDLIGNRSGCTLTMNPPPRNEQEVQVRAAAFPADGPTVENLFREYAASLGLDLAFQQFDEEVAGLPGRYAPPGGRLLLVYVGATPGGCVALRPLNEGGCEMKRLYVRPALRGKGIGRRLVQRVLAEAQDAGYSRVYLDTLPSMREAIVLYESFGFRDTEPYCHNPVPGARFLAMDLKRHDVLPAPVNLREKFGRFSDYWNPKIVGELNGQQVKLVKLRGEFIWHKHDNEDELFLILKGRLRMEFRERHVWLNEGEFLIVPRGVEHRPVAEEEVHVMLFEPASTLNTGNVPSDRTVAEPERI